MSRLALAAFQWLNIVPWKPCGSRETFDGIAEARSERPPRQIDDDQKIAEEPIFSTGDFSGASGDAQTDAMEQRAQTGLEVLGQNIRLAYRFDEDTLQEILSFKTADRTQAFVKELQDTDLMSAGVLPDAMSEADRVAARSYLQSAVQEP